MREENSEGRGGLFESVWRDVRYGFRVLRRSPGFTLAAVMTLALGIGANTAIFSVIYGVLLRPLPYREGDRLVVLRQQARLNNASSLGFSPKEFFDYRDQNKTMESMVEHHSMNFILYGRDEPERVQTGVVSANFFDVLGVKPLLGRSFRPEDETPGGEAVLMLSHKYWQRSHGGDPAIVGRVFRMNNRPHTVIGVLPPIPEYPSESDVYMPTVNCPFRSSPQTIENRQARLLSVVFGRLKPGATLEQAQSDVDAVAGNLQATYPDNYPKNIGYGAQATGLAEALTQQARPTFLILLATTGLVLLIACANVANLNLARVLRRQPEMAMRTALGASRGRLVRQMLTESVLLSVGGGVLGLLLASWGLPLLTSFAARFTNRTEEIGIDSSVLLFALLLSVGTGLVFGLLPALSVGKGSKESLSAALKEDGGRSTAAGKNRVRALLTVAQVAISFTLLIGAGLMLRSLIKLQQVDPGFNPENALVMRLAPNWSRFINTNANANNNPNAVTAQYAAYFQRLLERVNRQPGVAEAAISSTYPLNPAGLTQRPNGVSVLVEGKPLDNGQAAPRLDARAASPAYFRAAGVPLLRGRMFTEADDLNAPRVSIVNEAAARHRWGNEDPVGKRVSFDNGQTWVTIVGVVGNVRQYGLDKEPSDEIYGPVAQLGFGQFLVVKAKGDPMALSKSLRDAVHEVDNETAVDQVKTLQQALDDSVASPRLTAWLLGLFAVVALVITAAGISGVMALAVTQRTREIGIRIALGATRTRIVTMIMRQGMTLVLVGLGLGVCGALALNGLIASLLFATPGADPLTFAAVSFLLMLVAGTACLIPSLRATAIDPMLTLRRE
ncbi:MAG TPA: ABC transporter permease [Pyrinomonadaceae bacterium]|nr:ABC transporter permease [Pyrinomonadaceae bacterium]